MYPTQSSNAANDQSRNHYRLKCHQKHEDKATQKSSKDIIHECLKSRRGI
uniref:Uncharacterized protein n=1 Tax=Arundo donax TaxID=35708 RepID=A0A0A9S8W4_ARUDO